jgi:selenocysteine lyase/cysteine desulfurase
MTSGQSRPASWGHTPGYRSTALLDRLRATEYSYLDAGGHTYLDYTGAGLPAQAQLNAHTERLRGRCFGNPHSENPTSSASTELIERARLAVLAHFNASPEEYAAIFTPNASGACRLVGEACFCNPGAGEGAFGLTQADWRRAARGHARTMNQYLDLLGLPSGGALRASVGLASNVDDVERFLAFVELTYTDRVVGTAGLAPRQGC